MEEQIFDKSNGLWYEPRNGCYYPCLAAPEERHIGVWGRQHEQSLQEYRPTIYHSLLLSGKLNAYLVNIDQQTQEQYEQLIEQMKQAHGITEELKAADPMAWVGRMNTVQSCVKEIINTETIFA